VINYYQALPWSKKPQLLNIYEIVCENSIDAKQLVSKLENNFLTYFPIIKHIPEPISLGSYDPSDYMWNSYPEWLWHLHIIDADQAWYITKGSPDVKIAIIDSWFDINHPDLEHKFTTISDPMTGTIFNSNCKLSHHGTTVASFAAAHTDGGGQLSSIGFNSMIIPYSWMNGLAKAHHASIVQGADVISISWFSGCTPDLTGID
jgi:subtilisin family serine protease